MKLHRGWRHCYIIKRQRDGRLNIKVVPSLGSYKRHFDVRRLVLCSPYLRLPAMFPKMCTTFLMRLLGFLIFLWLNDGNMSVIQVVLSMTLDVWALDLNSMFALISFVVVLAPEWYVILSWRNLASYLMPQWQWVSSDVTIVISGRRFSEIIRYEMLTGFTSITIHKHPNQFQMFEHGINPLPPFYWRRYWNLSTLSTAIPQLAFGRMWHRGVGRG